MIKTSSGILPPLKKPQIPPSSLAFVTRHFVYFLQNAVEILKNLRVPEAQHAVASAPQKFIALSIAGFPLGVAAAVEFDHEFFGHAGEIRYVGADGLLAAEFAGTEPFAAQASPQQSLRVRVFAAEGLGVLQGISGVSTVGVGLLARWRVFHAVSSVAALVLLLLAFKITPPLGCYHKPSFFLA